MAKYSSASAEDKIDELGFVCPGCSSAEVKKALDAEGGDLAETLKALRRSK